MTSIIVSAYVEIGQTKWDDMEEGSALQVAVAPLCLNLPPRTKSDCDI